MNWEDILTALQQMQVDLDGPPEIDMNDPDEDLFMYAFLFQIAGAVNMLERKYHEARSVLNQRLKDHRATTTTTATE